MKPEIKMFSKLKENTRGFLRQKWFNMNKAVEILNLDYCYINWNLSLLHKAGLIKKKGPRKGRRYKCNGNGVI